MDDKHRKHKNMWAIYSHKFIARLLFHIIRSRVCAGKMRLCRIFANEATECQRLQFYPNLKLISEFHSALSGRVCGSYAHVHYNLFKGSCSFSSFTFKHDGDIQQIIIEGYAFACISYITCDNNFHRVNDCLAGQDPDCDDCRRASGRKPAVARVIWWLAKPTRPPVRYMLNEYVEANFSFSRKTSQSDRIRKVPVHCQLCSIKLLHQKTKSCRSSLNQFQSYIWQTNRISSAKNGVLSISSSWS